MAHDIDRHSEGDDPAATWRAAKARYEFLVDLGFRPLLIDSNGNGGYKLYVIFDEEITAQHARRFGLWLARDWADHGLPKLNEVFPAQDEIGRPGSGEREYGNWLRLPGRHHKRDHFSRVWDGEDWLEGDDAIDAILNHQGDSPQLIPDEVIEFGRDRERERAERSTRVLTDADLEGEAAKARDALKYLGPGVKDDQGREHLSDYDAWIRIGFALHALGDVGFVLWDEWSRQDAKYDGDVLALKWSSMTSGGITLGTLYHHAKLAGWVMPSRPMRSYGEGGDFTYALRSTSGGGEANGDPTEADPIGFDSTMELQAYVKPPGSGLRTYVKPDLSEEVRDIAKKRGCIDLSMPWGKGLFALVRELKTVADDQGWSLEMWGRAAAYWMTIAQANGMEMPGYDAMFDKLKKKVKVMIKEPSGAAYDRVQERIPQVVVPPGISDTLAPVFRVMTALHEESVLRGDADFYASLRFIGGLTEVSHMTAKTQLEVLGDLGYLSRVKQGDSGASPRRRANTWKWHPVPIPGQNVWATPNKSSKSSA
jgi:hypothetical protein